MKFPIPHVRGPARLLTTLIAACGLALAAALVAVTQASATTGCSVSYTLSSQWNSGFTTAIAITNLGGPVTRWDLKYGYAGNQTLTNGWDGRWTQIGASVTVTNATWNGSLAHGGSVLVGANFSFSGTDANPTVFSFNGITCNADTSPSPSPSVTVPSASASPTSSPSPSPSPTRSRKAPQLRVSGNRLVSATGQRVVLHGVDRSGTEYECVGGNGIFDGPSDEASITAMKSWGINAVRVPLNEACWNAESYVNPAYAGASYQAAIKAYVGLLNRNGMVAILDLHWTDGLYTGPSSGCASAEAVCQKPMPDSAQSIAFWTSVAEAFKGNNAVIFDLFNEPYPEAANSYNETEGWQCWLYGASDCPGISYPVAGMQTLVNAVRGAGARNVIMLGGLDYANDLTQWLAYEPADPDHNLVASWHSYQSTPCDTPSCWTSQVAPVITEVPVIAGEIGEFDCADTYIDPLMTWLDAEKTSYLAWAWNADFNCSSGPGLITSYSGYPTAYGAGYRSHLKALTRR
jgi:hypothetical protein